MGVVARIFASVCAHFATAVSAWDLRAQLRALLAEVRLAQELFPVKPARLGLVIMMLRSHTELRSSAYALLLSAQLHDELVSRFRLMFPQSQLGRRVFDLCGSGDAVALATLLNGASPRDARAAVAYVFKVSLMINHQLLKFCLPHPLQPLAFASSCSIFLTSRGIRSNRTQTGGS